MTGAQLFREVPSPDDARLSQIQKNLKDALNALAAKIEALAFPVLYCSASAQIQPGRAVVVFAGNAGQTLMLPRAASQGPGVSLTVIVMNTAPVSVLIRCAGTETVNGAVVATRGAGGVSILVSDGVSKWLAK